MIGEPIAIHWGQLEPRRYEHLVATLLSTENPDVRRVDGTGGDEGCDVSFPTPDGLVIYELKSWTGRLSTGNRWSQLQASLNRAAERTPLRWIVVCPIDLTPGEKRRFDALAAGREFTADWFGRTWLDARMSAHPQLVRYFGTSHDEVVNLLTQMGSEQAALAEGIPDASRRLQSLAAQVDELDPFHHWSLTIGEGEVRVSRRPRYAGADADSPPQIVAQFSFPATEEGRAAQAAFQRALDHGEPTEVGDEYITEVRFENIPDSSDRSQQAVKVLLGGDSEWDERATLAIVDDLDLEDLDEESDAQVTLPIRFFHGRGGEKSRRATARDDSGSLTVTLTIESGSHVSVTLSFDPAGVIPAATAPVRSFLQAMHAGRGITMRLEDAGVTIKPLQIADGPGGLGDVAVWVEELDFLQQLSGRYFPTPPDLTAEDHQDIADAVDILLGGSVIEPWTQMSLTGPAERVLEQLDGLRSGGAMVAIGAMSLELGEHRVPLGVCSTTFVDAVLEDAARLEATARAAAPDENVDMVFVPRGEARKITARWSQPSPTDKTSSGVVAEDI